MYAVTAWMVQPRTCQIVGTKMEQNNLNLKQSKAIKAKQTKEHYDKKKRAAYGEILIKRYEKALFIMSKIENNKRNGIIDERDNKCRNKCKKTIEEYHRYKESERIENTYQQDRNNKEQLAKGASRQGNKGKEINIKQPVDKLGIRVKPTAFSQSNLTKQNKLHKHEKNQDIRAKTSVLSCSNLAREKSNEKLNIEAKQIGITQTKYANEKPQGEQREVVTEGIKVKKFVNEQEQNIRSISTVEKPQGKLEKLNDQSVTTQLKLKIENKQEKQTNTSSSCLSPDDLCMALANVSTNGELQPVIEEWPEIELKMSDILMDYLLHNKNCPIPRYKSGEIYQGFLLIQCQDTFSKNFLNNCILKVREAFKDLNLTIIPASKMPLPKNIINTQTSYLESQKEENSDLEPPPPPAWSNDNNEESIRVKGKNYELSYQHALLRLNKFKQRERINPRYRRKIKKCLRKIKNYELHKELRARTENTSNKQPQTEGFQLSVNYFEDDLQQQQVQQTDDDFKQCFQLSINYFETDLKANKDKEQLIQQPTLGINNFYILQAETENFETDTEQELITHNSCEDIKQSLTQTLQDSQKYLEHKQSSGDYVVKQEEMSKFEENKSFESKFPSISCSNLRTNSLGTLNDFKRGTLSTNLYDSQASTWSDRSPAQILPEFPLTSRWNMEGNSSRNLNDPNRESFPEMWGISRANNCNPTAKILSEIPQFCRTNMGDEIDHEMPEYFGKNNFNLADQTSNEFSARRNMTTNSAWNSKDSDKVNFNEMPGYSKSKNFQQISQRSMETAGNFPYSNRRCQTNTKHSDNIDKESLKADLEKRILECLNNLSEEMLEDQPETPIEEQQKFIGAKHIEDYNHKSNSSSSSLKCNPKEYQIYNIQESRTKLQHSELQGSSSSQFKRKSEYPVGKVITLSDDSENSDIEDNLKKSENLKRDRLDGNFKRKSSGKKMAKSISVSAEKKTRWNPPETSNQTPSQQHGFWSCGSGTIYQNINPKSYTSTSS